MSYVNRGDDKGFTLIEAMVTMLIVSVGLLAMANLLITGIKVNQNSELRMNASSISQAILSSVILKARNDGAYAGSAATTDAQTLLKDKYVANGVGGYNPIVTFTPSSTASGAYTKITLVLQWSDHGTMKKVQVRGGVYTE